MSKKVSCLALYEEEREVVGDGELSVLVIVVDINFCLQPRRFQ